MSDRKNVTARDWDDDWEDLSDDDSPKEWRSSSLPATSRSSRQNSPRKRKLGNRRNVQTTRDSHTSSVNPRPRAAVARPNREFPTEEWIAGLSGAAKSTLNYLVDVLGGGVYLLRRPLSVLIFLWLFAFIIGYISSTLKTALKPLCIIPGISSTSLCSVDAPRLTFPKSKGSTAPQWADYPALMNAQSLTFEQLLDDSVGGSGLSLDIKKAEMATSDLITLVKFSKLTSKDLLAESLAGFVDDARRTGRGLQKLGSKVGGAVDQILAVNDYAINSISAQQSSSPSVIQYLNPFRSAPSTNEIVLRTFVEAMGVLSSTVERLIVEAEVQLANLEKLEERLSLLHELVSREDSSISGAKADLLAELWTKLGGNKRTLKGYDDHLTLLRGLSEYRKQALAHVVSALQTLRALSDDMEDMRERVSEPELAGSHIPVEVHMNSIQLGLRRLKDSRVKAQEREQEAIKKVLGAEQFAALMDN
ncbi:hypothetical protein BDP27DRAFT_1326218 [Rhodocollybia butyracea]|uniref:Uncharacterized protein n=1 Tax=Rhodocollybia butyracea TaxID=206335 RepID=A0A9P5U7G1_9AGAR|nr:hypothetical protein BDP27DRAFT_1326218 [Rhodocollybia butyracea]